ncbi:MAG TPA: hypothetical protein VLL52_16560 [Anaerolineae bacterium]|nr:hypothetical protein [Anaerolineae bacterium]
MNDNILKHINKLEHNGLVNLAQEDPELEYIFRHALVQDAAYQSLLHTERQKIHLWVATTLEQLYADRLADVAPILADHFRAANKLDQASHYFTLAGDTAFDQFANEEAVSHYQAAFACQPVTTMDVDTLTHLYTNLGRALEHLGQGHQAAQHYQQFEAIAHDRQDQSLLLTATTLRAKLAAVPGPSHDLPLAQTLLQQGLALAREQHNQAAEARLLWIAVMADTFHLTTNEETIHNGKRSLTLARALNLKEQLAFTLHNLALAYVSSKYIGQGIPMQLEANQLWQEQNNQAMFADGLANIAMSQTFLGHYEDAISQAQASYHATNALEHHWGQVTSQFPIGIAYFERGEFATGIHRLNHVLPYAQKVNHVPFLASSRADLALMYAYCGQTDTAQNLLDDTITLNQQISYLRPWLHSIQADFYIWQNQPDKAAEILHPYTANLPNLYRMGMAMRIALTQAKLAAHQERWADILTITAPVLAYYNETPSQFLQAAILTYRGRALAHLGQPTPAHQTLLTALDLAQQQNLRHRLWPIYHTLALLTTDPTQAATYRQQAHTTIHNIAALCGPPQWAQGFLNHPEVAPVLTSP